MFLPYGHQSINEADIAAVASSLKGDIITRGPVVEAFEKAVADYVGAKFAVAFTSGSTALEACYVAGEIAPGDRVLTSPNSFIASSGPASLRGADIVFVDIDRHTGNLDLEAAVLNFQFRSLKGKLFIVPVHFSGIAVDMQHLHQEAGATNIVVIEDAAHAIGSYYPDGKKVGSCAYSDMTVFSFHPVKTITTGEGGMVTTNDPHLYEKLKVFRNSGIQRDPPFIRGKPAPWYYEVEEISGNYHMNDLQAALGISQLSRIDQFVEKRRQLVTRYRAQLKGIPYIKLFDDSQDAYTAFHLMVVQIDFQGLKTTRTEVMNALKEAGIGTQLHYIPLYRHPCYRDKIGEIEQYFPEMEAYYAEALSLPLYFDLKIENVDEICKNLLLILRK